MNQRPRTTEAERLDLQAPVRFLKGVGPVRAEALARLGVRTLSDLLHLFPRAHEDRRNLRRVRDLVEGEVATLRLEVREASLRFLPRRRSVLRVRAGDGTGEVTLVLFNQPYRRDQFPKGARLVVSGAVSRRGGLQLVAPDVEPDEEEGEGLSAGRLVPVYPLSEGIGQVFLRGALRRLLDRASPLLRDPRPAPPALPPGPMALPEALREIHFPASPEALARARARLVYEEFFLLELLMALRKARVKLREEAPALRAEEAGVGRLRALLPFSLTPGQEGALAEIRSDLSGPRPMNRLLQGDVGSGKTAVALLASGIAILGGAQAAILAPTEILAAQHHRGATRFCDAAGFRSALLTGGLGPARRRRILEQIREGSLDLVVGTHALLVEDVAFRRLGFAVVDEQHRFGVLQRARLREKGLHPHVLVMTATPIPRTLALTVYGDLDVTVIPDRPPGRVPPRTRVVAMRRRAEVHERVRERLRRGERAYFVYPLIEESDALPLRSATAALEELGGVFPGYRVALLHGRQTPEEKAASLDAFREGGARVLASTTVVEVGMDVPEATVMVVEHAERFGLAQLHQLRGRIGRGGGEAECFLLAGSGSPEARARLRSLAETESGFEVAEADLRLRGPGELAGLRQHGLPDLRIGDLARDVGLLQRARRDAFEMVARDPDGTGPGIAPFLGPLRERFTEGGALLDVG